MTVEQQSKKMQADFALSGLFIKWCLDPNGLGARSIEDFEYAMGTETDAATIIEAAEVKDTILPQLELDRVNKMLWLPLSSRTSPTAHPLSTMPSTWRRGDCWAAAPKALL